MNPSGTAEVGTASLPPSHVLVAGGTGFVGSRIVAGLLDRFPSVRVRILSHRAQTSNPRDPRLQYVQANVCNPATLEPALREIDAVVACAQFPHHPVENPERGWTYLQVDGRGTRNLAAAARKAGARRFVYLSLAGIDTEEQRSWARAKRMAEAAVRGSGMRFLILRPTWICGQGNPWLDRYRTALRFLPFAPVPGDGRVRTRPVSVSDVARAVLEAFASDSVWDRTLDVGGPQELSLDEVVRTLMTVWGRKRPLVHIPVPLFRVFTGLVSMVPGATISPQWVEYFLREVRCDPCPAEQALGLRFAGFETDCRGGQIPS